MAPGDQTTVHLFCRRPITTRRLIFPQHASSELLFALRTAAQDPPRMKTPKIHLCCFKDEVVREVYSYCSFPTLLVRMTDTWATS